jgi:type II secretion system protein H
VNNDRPKCSRAFTLIELIVVLMLLALIVGLVVPSLRAFTIGRANHFAATQFLSEVRFARTQALTEGKTYRVIIEANTGEFYVAADNGGGTFEAVTADLGHRIRVADGVRIETDLPRRDDGTYVEIQPNGLLDPGRVTFINAANATVDVTCDSVTDHYRIAGGAQ